MAAGTAPRAHAAERPDRMALKPLSARSDSRHIFAMGRSVGDSKPFPDSGGNRRRKAKGKATMKTRRCGSLIAISLLAAVGGVEAQTSVEAARRAARNDAKTREGREWGRGLGSSMGAALTPIMRDCAERSPDGSDRPFAIYIRLLKAGGVREAVPDPSAPFTRCLADGMLALHYPNVPRDDYWFAIEMHMRTGAGQKAN